MRQYLGIVVLILAAGAVGAGDVTVTGRVMRSDSGGPANGIRVDFVNVLSGEERLDLTGTDLGGRYTVSVPEGIWEVSFDDPGFLGPPLLAHGRLPEASVVGPGPVALPEVTLVPGFRVSGRVEDSSSTAVADASVEFHDGAGVDPVFTKYNTTDASGEFSAIVPGGSYDVEIHPPPGPALASVRGAGVLVSGTIDLGVETLPVGVALTGTVVDPQGTALREVMLSVDGQATTDDRTDAAGQFSILVPLGVYTIEFVPLVSSLVDPGTEFAVVVSGPTVRDVDLDFHNEDNDGAVDVEDTCPFRASLFQEDFENDGFGGLCDNCPLSHNPRQENNDLTGGGDACDPDDDDDGLADLSDTDVDGDLVLNVGDNCPGASNPGQQDRDGNDVGDACDPDDGEVESFEARGKTTFKWRSEDGPSGYHVYRQRIAWLSSINYGRCFHDVDGGHAFMRDETIPSPGQGFAYLATAVVGGVEGSLGADGAGAERPNLRPCD